MTDLFWPYTDEFQVGAALAPVVRPSPESEFPLTLDQKRAWLLAQLAPGSPVHHLALTARMRGTLDVQALRRSLRLVVDRHEALRLAVRLREGSPMQRVGAEADPPLVVHDLGAEPSSTRAARLAELERLELERPLDIEDGPLVRFALFRLDENDHELLAVLHRLGADRHSLAVVERELTVCYDAFAAGRPPGLSELPLQFPDFAAWQHELSSSGSIRDNLEHWERALADLPDPLELPFSRPRGTLPALASDTTPFSVPPHVARAARELADEEDVSPGTLMLSALVGLLHRYTRRNDVVVGIPVPGRDRPGAGGLVGPLEHALPLRVRLPDEPSWRTIVRSVRETASALRRHQDVAFQQLVELTRPERHLDMHPLFQVLFAPAPAASSPQTAGGVSFTFAAPGSGHTLYDLEVRPAGGPDFLDGVLEYRTELFDREAIEAVARHFVRMLEQLADAPDEHLSNLSLLEEAERQQVVYAWNRTATDYPRDRCVHALFEERASATPDAPALRWERSEVTYRELDERANRLARHLRDLGVGLETRVGLYFGHTADWVIGALATLKAGGAYVPLDPSYPPERLAAMCEEAEVRVLLLHGRDEGRFDFGGASRVKVDTDSDQIDAQTAEPLDDLASADNLAYVMFTSGSTGRPKAIGVIHRNVVRTVCETNYVVFEPGDTVGQASNISFDAATLEAWGALLNGSRLVGLRKEDVLDPKRLRERLVAEGIDIFFIPSALMKQIVTEAPDTFSTLRYFLSGGEQADYHTLRRIVEHGAPRHLINPYGPTETTVFAATYRCNDLTESETHVPIGYPIGNTQCYVLDQHLQPVPPGVMGELFVGGDGVARGYLGQPAQTADKFVPDPFGGEAGARLYRTGDLARYRQDGVLEFLGRIDRQVKVRGFRIEPGDIEECLLRSGRVGEVSVQVARDRGGDDALIAYVVPAVPGLAVEELRAHAREHLPAYMVPASFVLLESLPLNANGKLDARALQGLGGTQASDEPADPSTVTEARLEAIWLEVLDVPALSIDDDFFWLGGDSWQAVEVAARASALFRREVPVRLLFEHRTLASFAEAVDVLRARPPEEVPTAPAPPPVPEESAAATLDRVVEIWRDVLGVPAFEPDEDFFALGGHSLNATRIVSRMSAVVGCSVPLQLLFDHPTAASFADAVDRLVASGPGDEAAIERGEEGAQGIADLLDEVEAMSDEQLGSLLGPES